MALATVDLHWAAGFLEGEGSFTAVPAGKRPDGSPRLSFNLSVNAGQKDKEPLERVQRIFGGNIYHHNMHTEHPCWRWQLNGTSGAGLMMTLWSLMSARRKQQIETALIRWKSNRTYKEAALRGETWRMARGR